MKTRSELRSPKGIIGIRKITGAEAAAHFEHVETAPGEFEIQSDSRVEIEKRIAFYRRIAKKAIERDGEAPEHYRALAEGETTARLRAFQRGIAARFRGDLPSAKAAQ